MIPCNEVVCSEYTNHCIYFTLLDGEKVKSNTISGKFADYMAEFIEKPQFIQPHTSFVMNMRYMERFDKDVFTLRGDVRVPISARHYTEVRDRYMDYLMKEGN